MPTQYHQYLIVMADELLPDIFGAVITCWITEGKIDNRTGQPLARRTQVVMRCDQCWQAGILVDDALRPGQHVIAGLHFKRKMQEAIATCSKHLRTAAAAVVAIHVPGFIAKKISVTAKDRAEIIQAAYMRESEIGDCGTARAWGF